jgi:hypothetical protein
MSDAADVTQDAVEKGQGSRLSTMAAVLVALTATFMALCNVKDGNVTQAMAQVQTKAVDQWSYYQAKSTKQAMAENSAGLVALQRDLAPTLSKEARGTLDARVADFKAKAAHYEEEKAAIKAEAERLEKEYDTLNTHDDQFDMAEAGFTVAIALAGITILTQRRWLLGLAGLFSAFGFVMGLAGFLKWNLHPDWLAKLLG